MVLILLAVGYPMGILRARREGRQIPGAAAILCYALGTVLYGWATLGFLGVYSQQQRWLWITKISVIFFMVPWLIALGRPAALLETALDGRGRARVQSFFDSRFMRIIGSAVFEPIFGLVFLMLLLTPLAGPMRTMDIWQEVVDVALLVVGVLTVVPMAEDTRPDNSVKITFEFMIAFAALVMDAIPGLCMRLLNPLLDGVHAIPGVMAPWFKSGMSDQRMAGDILWCLAESVDMPILFLVFLRWHRVDRQEARAVDELSDDEFDELVRAHLNGRPH